MPKYAGRLAAILFFLAAASCLVTAVLGSPEERITRAIIGGVCAGLAGAILFFDATVGTTEKAEPKIVSKEAVGRSYISIKEKTQNE